MQLLDKLTQIPDPRMAGKVKYPLSSILFVTLCAVLSGAGNFEDIQDYWFARKRWLSKFIDAKLVPSIDTIRRVFTLIEPEYLEEILVSHAREIVEQQEATDQISIDGKALCGSATAQRKALTSLSAFCPANNLVLAEKQVEVGRGEMTALPDLLEALDLKGQTITIDAGGCQKPIIQKIFDKKAHYVIGLKKNQPKAYKSLEEHFNHLKDKNKYKISERFDESHGRLIRRRVFAFPAKKMMELEGFAGIKSVVALETISSQKNHPSKKVTVSWRYYITSHKHLEMKIPQYIREHWSIENKLHWILDVHFKEDDDLKKERQTVRCFALLKRIILNIVRSKDKTEKKSLRRKLKRARWDEEHLLFLLR